MYLYLTTVCCLFVCIYGSKDEQTLLKDIFSEYNVNVRPRKNRSETVDVSVLYSLRRLDNLNLRHQTFQSSGWLTLNWRDDYITWEPSSYSNITRILITAKRVWIPDIAIDNSVGPVYDANHKNLFRVVVDHEGWVEFEPGGSITTSCAVDTTFYPFDHQTCYIVFANWQYTISEVNLITTDDEVNIEMFMENGEWMIESTEITHRERAMSCCPDLYPEVVVKIKIRRRHNYYVVNIITPCIMMSLLILMVFHLPVDSGEKVSLGVTVLLTFTVFHLMIADTMPPSPQSTPVFEILLLWFMAESCFSVAISVLVLNIHHRTAYHQPPIWLHNLVLGYLAHILCMPYAVREFKTKTPVAESDTVIVQPAIERKKSLFSKPVTSIATGIKKVANYLSSTKKEEEKGAVLESEWKTIASVVDRFFFIVTLVVMICSLSVIFVYEERVDHDVI